MLDMCPKSGDTAHMAKNQKLKGGRASKPRSYDLQQRACVSLEPELFQLIEEYHKAAMQATGPRWPADTVRELLWAGINNRPDIAVLRAIRVQLAREMEAWILSKAKIAVTGIKNELDALMKFQIQELAAHPETLQNREDSDPDAVDSTK